MSNKGKPTPPPKPEGPSKPARTGGAQRPFGEKGYKPAPARPKPPSK